MLDRIRLRLTAAYVSILAVILGIFGVIAVLIFRDQAYIQQDDLLEQHARSRVESLLAGRESDFLPDPGKPYAAWGSVSRDGRIADPSPGPVGLLSMEQATRTIRTREPSLATVAGREGALRVSSLPVIRDGRVVAVVQTGQLRAEVQGEVRRLVVVLIPTGLGALALAAVGGLLMSRRAMRPVRASFDRQRTFIADASHELKTPLTLIRADAEVLARGLPGGNERELVEDLVRETDRMADVLADLLLLARLDAGKLAVTRRSFDLAAVLREAADRFAPAASATGRRLDLSLTDALSGRGDPESTERIMAAVLDNALRVTPEGGTIHITARTTGGWVEASVTDEGPGIPAESLPHIFERFFRAESARTREHGGTGLGLAIAGDLARAQGGYLAAEASAGGGARFTLRLPAGDSDPPSS